MASFRMVSNLEEFTSILGQRNYAGLEMEVVFFPDETHDSVIAPTITRGLRSIYRGWTDGA